jgi:enamine deaminase RidA (YjgF/YER057c/UK114 family)
MPVNLDTRTIESPAVTEIYISAVPDQNAPADKQAQEIFSAIADTLRSKKAAILQERVFAVQDVTKTISDIRSKQYGALDDGVTPSLLVCAEGRSGPIAGVQVHAIAADTAPEPIDFDGTRCGRILRVPGRTYLTLSNISAPDSPQPTQQAAAMLEKGEAILKQSGTDMLSVARTWMWLADILSWYDDFNHVRNEFFTERGIIGQNTRQSMPASTGIGLAPADGAHCAMDLIAVLEPADSVQYLPAVGKQQCALEYGSAFSRASKAAAPAAETVFVSGTASIDADGNTTNIDDAEGQINTTIENVRAVLKDMNCADSDVVQIVAYCKTADVENILTGLKDTLPWPWLSAICDVCRPDLLFEIEAAATLSS